MNPEMLDSVRSLSKEENEQLNILVIGGSQWAEKIFENLIKILPDCGDIIFHVILWTNENQKIKKSLLKHTNVKTYGFIPHSELAHLYILCDIAITRWSSTLWELFYFGVHSIIVPLRAAWNHQFKNAEYFNKNYWSDILDEDANLNLELFRKLQLYKSLRKRDLNLEWFLDGVKKIQEEIT
jgi:UDP-N-acetylglucosamine:LPS N-acetylglucosamine transferase